MYANVKYPLNMYVCVSKYNVHIFKKVCPLLLYYIYKYIAFSLIKHFSEKIREENEKSISHHSLRYIIHRP